ncbi:hypothetical protein [Bifidobacterium tissieri]|uniref:hypothetical protein n=1 Tax=Bifidobacterium tissieri TaxID=1630162 RepID=UPI00123C6E76|nr:hypothetical protein [Bifidobacterium tissieri]KAA8832595.1 hypothetical protein EM849_03560 [Bifidobacterium tissieri]
MTERRPAWLTRFCKGSPDRLTPVQCACGQWVISERNTIWVSWDPFVLTGRDITIALILHRPLCRVEWDPLLGRAILRTVLEPKPDDHCLCAHECGKPPLGHGQPAMSTVRPVYGVSRGYSPPEINAADLAEFTRIWATPYDQLPEQ